MSITFLAGVLSASFLLILFDIKAGAAKVDKGIDVFDLNILKTHVLRTRLQNPNKNTYFDVNDFITVCHAVGTDKCYGSHSYQYAYSRYLSHLRKSTMKILEIGLGCGQLNLGASAKLWTSYFTDVEVHIMEYNKECALKWYQTQTPQLKLKVKLHFGDQSLESDLNRVVKEAEGFSRPFDIIVDDGGHGMKMQQVSLAVLFNFIKPGGLYFLEDLLTSYTAPDEQPTTVDALKTLLDWMHGDPRLNVSSNRYGMLQIMPDVEHMDCYAELCVFQKYSKSAYAFPYTG
jgi:hypothetical protein